VYSFKGVVKADGEYKQQHWSSHSEGVSATGIQFWSQTSQLSTVAGTVSTLITKVDKTFNIRACSQRVL